MPGPLAIVIDKEKCAGFPNRAAQGRAELILPKCGSGAGQVEEIFSIEDIVAHKFVGAAMELVGPRFRDDVDHRTRFPAEFRVVVGFVDYEFGRVVRRRTKDNIVEVFVRDAHSIHQKQVVAGPLSQDVYERAGLLQRIAARASGRVDHSFAEQGKFKKLAVLERQVGDLLVLDHVFDFRGFRLHQSRGELHDHRFSCVAQCK